MNRPDYVLKLADGREIKLTPIGNEAWQTKDGYFFTAKSLKSLGATPVEPKRLEYFLQFGREICGELTPITSMHFKSHKDAENYRLRCESIGPEWTDWEPEEGCKCWYIRTLRVVQTEYIAKIYGADLSTGRVHPTKERAEEWLDKYGKAWGLM